MENIKTPDLTLRGLRAFVAVEETGSVSDGAKRINGSSSGVSQQITALELAVGAKLFDRGSRPMKLTPAGQMLRAHAHKILQTVFEAQAELSKQKLIDLPKITLAIIDDLDASLAPDLVTKLQQHFRQCFVNAYSGRSDQVVEMLQQREADICISAIIPDDIDGFTSIPILREPFILVTAKGLLNTDEDIPSQLSNEPFIQYSESIPIGRAITQHIKRMRFKAPQNLALEATRSVIAMVIQSNGWALTTPLNLLDAERFIADVDIYKNPFPAFSRHIYMIARTAEFGDLPDQLAGDCRELLSEKVISRIRDIVPELKETIEIITP